MAALYTLLEVTVGVSFERPVPINNDPLTNSVLFTSISSNRIMLASGRVVVMLGYSGDSLAREMSDSGGRIEVESDGSGLATVNVRQKRFRCGTHGPLIFVPLVRQEYPGYGRHVLGLARLE
jgi:hypothetical protein